MSDTTAKVTCRNCLRQVPKAATKCAFCRTPTATAVATIARSAGPDAPDTDISTPRTPSRSGTWSPAPRWGAGQYLWASIWVAVLGAVATVIAATATSGAALWVFLVASMLCWAWLLVAIIGKGVEVGLRAARRE